MTIIKKWIPRKDPHTTHVCKAFINKKVDNILQLFVEEYDDPKKSYYLLLYAPKDCVCDTSYDCYATIEEAQQAADAFLYNAMVDIRDRTQQVLDLYK